MVPQDLANTAWAFAVFCIHNGPLLASISAESLPKISEFNPQNLANIAWSFDVLECDDVPLMHAISAQAVRTLRNDDTGFGA